MAIMTINHQHKDNKLLPCASNILNPDKLSFADSISARIRQLTHSNRLMHLRRLTLLATEDAREINTFLREINAACNEPTFTWETIDDELANRLRRVLGVYHDLYQQVGDLKKNNWLTRQLTATDGYVNLTQQNNRMISEILLMLAEDREDVLAAQAALEGNLPTLSLEEVRQGLHLAV